MSSPVAPTSTRLLRAPLLWLLVATALVRGAALWQGSDGLLADVDDYRQSAEHLLERQTLTTGDVPSAYRPPLYPLLLAAWGAFFGLAPAAVGVLHWIIGIATVALATAIGRQWNLGRAAYLAGALTAVDPILVHQSTQVMTETLAAFLAGLALWSLGRANQRRSTRATFVAGLALALAALCRPTFLLWGLVSALAWAFWPEPAANPGEPARGWPQRVAAALACLAGLLLGLAPWGARNYWQLGAPIVTTTHGGYTCLLANNADFYRYLQTAPWREVWTSERLVERWNAATSQLDPDTELTRDRLAYQLAEQDIRAEPGTFVYACMVRLARFWSPLPHRVQASESSLGAGTRWSVGAFYVAEFFLASVGLIVVARNAPARQGWLWSLLLAACLTAGHLIYWTDLRMRAPAVPAISLFAAAGAAAVAHRGSGRKPL